jgi:NADH-quinone oxidoreductase subunit L
LADSLPLLFVGWEGVGMCSYLLIGFWYDDPAKAFAGRKAFITNRIGDFGFLVASFLMVMLVGALQSEVAATSFRHETLDPISASKRFSDVVQAKGPLAFSVLEDAAKTLPTVLDQVITHGPLAGHTFGWWLTVTMLLFMLGAAGKSAQIPLYVWLPDAMAGPTPVSALIHAATMVTSGLYLFCRISYLLVLSPTAMAVIALIGATTAFVAALIAFSQKGLKKVLAYSTVSQLGFMFLGIGAGAFWAAFLHVVTHAFFKACLFLGAGSVMHGNADEEDITKLGGLRKEMPTTWFTFLIATFAITGIVPLSGFFSKDAILHAAHTNELIGYGWVLHVAGIIGTITALCTAFYMMRLYFLTFEGARSKDAKIPQAHESSAYMTGPLVVLAALSVVALVHGLPVMKSGETLMENFLAPVFRTTYRNMSFSLEPPKAHESMIGVWVQAWLIALAGGGLAAYLYLVFFPSRKGQPLPGPLEALRQFSFNTFYVDELYTFILIRPLVWLAKGAWKVIDDVLIDTVLVGGSAWVTRQSSAVLRYMQTGDAQSYAAVMVVALASALIWALMRVMS